MIVDIDTRKMDAKKGDILMCDGKKFIKIKKEDFLKEVIAEIKKMKDKFISVDKVTSNIQKKHNKIDKFIKTLGKAGGSKDEKN